MFDFDTLEDITGFEIPEFGIDFMCHASPKDTHGPVVKTGPTAGQNRSRNKNGRWHKKRSDAGKHRNK